MIPGRRRLDAEADTRLDRAVAAACAGEERAWNEIYELLAPSLLGYLRSRNAPSPEDQLGEVMVQAVRDLRRFEGDGSDFRSWIFTIAHHRLLDARRGTARRPTEPLADEPAAELRGGDVTEDAAHSLSAQRVRAVLGELSDDQATVLTLRIIGDLSVDQVAAVIGKRPGAVKALQRRGLKAAEKILRDQGVTL